MALAGVFIDLVFLELGRGKGRKPQLRLELIEMMPALIDQDFRTDPMLKPPAGNWAFARQIPFAQYPRMEYVISSLAGLT
jgi:hypothetical protein